MNWNMKTETQSSRSQFHIQLDYMWPTVTWPIITSHQLYGELAGILHPKFYSPSSQSKLVRITYFPGTQN